MLCPAPYYLLFFCLLDPTTTEGADNILCIGQVCCFLVFKILPPHSARHKGAVPLVVTLAPESA